MDRSASQTFRKPHTLHATVLQNPADSDEFNDATLGQQWQWQANPEPSWDFPSQVMGVLRLINVPASSSTHNLWDTPALLLQKLSGPRFMATTKVTVTLRNKGDLAGLVLLGKDYGS